MRWMILAVAFCALLSACGSPAGPDAASATSAAPESTEGTTTTSLYPPSPADGPVQDGAEIAGSWRLVYGVADGQQFADPTTAGFYIAFRSGRVEYPINCNRAIAELTIEDGRMELGGAAVTEAGCGEPSGKSMSFVTAFESSTEISIADSELVLTSEGSELRFARPETAVTLGELPLTSAGAALTFDIPGDRDRFSHYLITGSAENLGRGPFWLLTTATEERGPETVRWEDAEVTPAPGSPGPETLTVLMPDDISVDDWALCSPYWQPEPYCFTLPVRLPSAPWFVTAGLEGVTLYDANGTSEVLTAEPAAIAFYIQRRLVWQSLAELEAIQVEGAAPIVIPGGGRLVDVSLVGGRPVGLTVGKDGSSVIDLESGDGIWSGQPADRGMIGAHFVILRSDSGLITVADFTTGDGLWELSAAPETALSLNADGVLRLDTMRTLQTDAGSDPYFQYVDTELIDLASGEILEAFSWEVAIPFEGDHIDQQCGLVDFDGELLLCPQPDGRIVSLQVNGGDSRTVAAGAISATFAVGDD